MTIHALTAFLLLAFQGQDIPERPEDLKYKALKFDVPDPASMRVELPGGAVLYVLEDKSLPKVDINVFVRAGAFWEPKGKEGVGAFCGQLMRMGGTTTRKPEALDDELDRLAAQLQVGVGDVSSSASLSLLSKDLAKGIEILFDILRNPAFDQEKLDLLKKQTMRRLESRNDRTDSIEAREANLLLYGDYPINRHPTGASASSITREDLAAFHADGFHPANFIIAAAGDFSKADLIAALSAAMKSWPGGKLRPAIPAVRHEATPGIYCFHKEGDNINQGRVTIGQLGIDVHHPDAFAVRVMSYIFGAGGFSSRLVQKVRTDMGLAYEVRSAFQLGTSYRGSMRIVFQSASTSCALAAKTCLEELDKMRGDLVSEAEIAAAKRFYLDAFPGLFFANAAQTVNTFAAAELNAYPKDYYHKYLDRISAVTREDVRRVAKELVDPSKFVIVIAGNINDIEAGDQHAKLADLGRPIMRVPLPDPVTLVRADGNAQRGGALCAECRKKAFTADVKPCPTCDKTMPSGGYKMCGECAAKAKVCPACGE